jgi:hypothetical protein
MAKSKTTTDLEKTSLEAHVDLCAFRYEQLDMRMTNLEGKVSSMHEDINEGNKSMTKVLVTSTATIIAGLLSLIVTILLKFN